MARADLTEHDEFCEGPDLTSIYGCGCSYRYETNLDRKIRMSGAPEWLAKIMKKMGMSTQSCEIKIKL